MENQRRYNAPGGPVQAGQYYNSFNSYSSGSSLTTNNPTQGAAVRAVAPQVGASNTFPHLINFNSPVTQDYNSASQRDAFASTFQQNKSQQQRSNAISPPVAPQYGNFMYGSQQQHMQQQQASNDKDENWLSQTQSQYFQTDGSETRFSNYSASLEQNNTMNVNSQQISYNGQLSMQQNSRHQFNSPASNRGLLPQNQATNRMFNNSVSKINSQPSINHSPVWNNSTPQNGLLGTPHSISAQLGPYLGNTWTGRDDGAQWNQQQPPTQQPQYQQPNQRSSLLPQPRHEPMGMSSLHDYNSLYALRQRQQQQSQQQQSLSDFGTTDNWNSRNDFAVDTWTPPDNERSRAVNKTSRFTNRPEVNMNTRFTNVNQKQTRGEQRPDRELWQPADAKKTTKSRKDMRPASSVLDVQQRSNNTCGPQQPSSAPSTIQQLTTSTTSTAAINNMVNNLLHNKSNYKYGERMIKQVNKAQNKPVNEAQKVDDNGLREFPSSNNNQKEWDTHAVRPTSDQETPTKIELIAEDEVEKKPMEKISLLKPVCDSETKTTTVVNNNISTNNDAATTPHTNNKQEQSTAKLDDKQNKSSTETVTTTTTSSNNSSMNYNNKSKRRTNNNHHHHHHHHANTSKNKQIPSLLSIVLHPRGGDGQANVPAVPPPFMCAPPDHYEPWIPSHPPHAFQPHPPHCWGGPRAPWVAMDMPPPVNGGPVYRGFRPPMMGAPGPQWNPAMPPHFHPHVPPPPNEMMDMMRMRGEMEPPNWFDEQDNDPLCPEDIFINRMIMNQKEATRAAGIPPGVGLRSPRINNNNMPSPPVDARHPAAADWNHSSPVNKMKQTLDDKHVLSKHATIYPRDNELKAVNEVVQLTETILKALSDQFVNEDHPIPKEDDEDDDSTTEETTTSTTAELVSKLKIDDNTTTTSAVDKTAQQIGAGGDAADTTTTTDKQHKKPPVVAATEAKLLNGDVKIEENGGAGESIVKSQSEESSKKPKFQILKRPKRVPKKVPDTRPRVLCGVNRVGPLAKGLLIHGDDHVELVLLCGSVPTKRLLDRVLKYFPYQMNENRPDVEYTITGNEAGFTIVAKSIVTIKVTVTLTSTSLTKRKQQNPPEEEIDGDKCEESAPKVEDDKEATEESKEKENQSKVDDKHNENEPQEEKDEEKPKPEDDEIEPLPEDMIPEKLQLMALAKLRHAKWFHSRASQQDSCVVIIRIMREMQMRFPVFAPLSCWALENLTYLALSTSTEHMSPGDAFRRLFEVIAGGLLLPDGPGIQDPCEREQVDVLKCCTDQQLEDITRHAQNALSLITFRGINQVLGMAKLPAYYGSTPQLPHHAAAHQHSRYPAAAARTPSSSVATVVKQEDSSLLLSSSATSCLSNEDVVATNQQTSSKDGEEAPSSSVETKSDYLQVNDEVNTSSGIVGANHKPEESLEPPASESTANTNNKTDDSNITETSEQKD